MLLRFHLMLTILGQTPLFLMKPLMSLWHHYDFITFFHDIITPLWYHHSTMTSFTYLWHLSPNTINTPQYRHSNLTCSYLVHLVITLPWLSTQSHIWTSQALWLAVIASGQQTVHFSDLTFEAGVVISTRVLPEIDTHRPRLNSTSSVYKTIKGDRYCLGDLQ